MAWICPTTSSYILVDTANKYIAEGDMDLDAWDPRIMAEVKTLWPDLSTAQVIDVTRCTAEYIERVLARNAGLPHPPDEDDHNHTVKGAARKHEWQGTKRKTSSTIAT